MKNYDLLPTYENIKNTLLNNKLDRNKSLFKFISLLQNIDNENISIAIDAQWGAGKTFFVQQAKLVLDAINPYIQTDNISKEKQDDFNKIKKLPENYGINNTPQLCVYYNAWENDNHEDPITSIIYSIAQDVSTDIKITQGKRDIGEIVKSIFGLIHVQFATPVAGTDQSIIADIDGQRITAIAEACKKKSDFGNIENESKLKSEINEFLNSLLTEKANRLVIFIDELDRCQPLFAVKLLERIKHYFDNPNVTFVFSTNVKELQNTIKKLYGEDFSASRYLDKFFDITIQLPPITIENYFEYLGFQNNSLITRARIRIARNCNLGLREINRLLKATNIANAMIRKNNQCFFDDDKYYHLLLDYLTPLLIALKMSNQKNYDDFIAGKRPDIFISVFNDFEFATAYLENWGMINVMGSDNRLNEDKFKQIYEAFFIEAGKNHISKLVGNIRISEKCITDLLEITSLLSEYSDFDEK